MTYQIVDNWNLKKKNKKKWAQIAEYSVESSNIYKLLEGVLTTGVV